MITPRVTMSGVSVLQHFEAYQKARVTFVQAVAEAATRPQNIEVMQNAGVMQLLRPLLLDNVSISIFMSNQVIFSPTKLHFCTDYAADASQEGLLYP